MSPRGRAQSKAVNAWKASAGFRRRQRASLARLRRQRETHAVHRWRAVSCEAAARREQLAVALHKLSPEGRAKRSALDQLRACVARAELMRGAVVRLANRRLSAGFESWQGTTEQSAHIRAQLRAVLLRRLATSFAAWVEAPPHPAHKVIARLANKPCSRAFNTWLSRYQGAVYARRSLRHFATCNGVRALRSWREFAEGRSLAAASLRRLHHAGLLRGWNGWVAYAEERFDTLCAMQEAAGSFRHQGLSKAWNAWLARLQRAADSPQRRAIALFASKAAASGWRSWQEFARMTQLQRRAASALTGRRQRAGLNSWLEWLAERAARRERSCAVMGRMRSPASRAFNSWASEHAFAGSVRGALRRLRHRDLSRAFEAWQARAGEQRVARRGAATFLHVSSARAFRALKACAARRAEDRELTRRALLKTTPLGAAFAAWTRHLAASQPLRRAATHFFKVSLVRALNSWEACRTQRRLMRRAAGSLFQKEAAAALRTWAASIAEAAARRERARAALCRMTPAGRAKARGIARWSAAVAERRLLRRGGAAFLHAGSLRALNLWRGRTVEAQVQRTALARALNRHLRFALRRWRAASQKGPVVSPATRAARRMQQTVVARAFDTLFSNLAPARLAKRSLAHFVHREQSRAFLAWEARYDEALMMAQAVLTMRQQCLSRAMRTWASSPARGSSKIEAALAGMAAPGLRRALNAWADHSETRRLARRIAARALHAGKARALNSWLDHLQRLEPLRRAAAHFTGQGTVRAWNAWENRIAELRLQRRAAAAMVGSGLYRGFSGWRARIAERAEEAEWLRGVAVRLTSRLAHGWAAWLEHCEQCGMARRALAGFSRGAERRGLNSWRGYVDELAARRELLRVAAVRFSSKLDDAWAAWIDFVSERELMQRAAAPMRAVGLKRALNCWAATVEERLERLDRVASFRRNVLDGMRAALGRWKEHQAALRPGRRALAHLSNRRTSQAWCSWCALLVELARKEAALLCMLNAALRRGFRSWRAFHAQRQLMRRAASGLRHHSLRRCFSRWEGSAEARAEKARIMRGKLSIAFGMRRQEARALNSWKHAMYERRRMLRGLASFLHAETARAWRCWLAARAHASEARRRMTRVLLVRQRRAFNKLRACGWTTGRVAASVAHWQRQAEAAALQGWRGYADRVRLKRRALTRFVLASQVRALGIWRVHAAESALMAAAVSALRNREARAAYNSWLWWLEARKASAEKMRAAIAAMVGVKMRAALNSWCAEKERTAPLRRGAARWANRPAARCFIKMREFGRERQRLRSQVHRMRHQQLVGCLRKWRAGSDGRRRRAGCVRAIQNPPVRRAVNTWVAMAARRQRLKAIMGTLVDPSKRRSLNRWKAVTRFRLRPGSPPPTPRAPMRLIQAMTWRQACTWLQSIGCDVSRSPPTLLRALKEGLVYQQLVRTISPYYFMRHKVSTSHERGAGSVFVMVQQFFDTEAVIAVVGCQKLDIKALTAGKAREHLDLVQTFRTVHKARRSEAHHGGW